MIRWPLSIMAGVTITGAILVLLDLAVRAAA